MKSGLTSLFLVLFLVQSLVQPAEVDAQHWQFFLDDHALARATGFDRVIHHPRPLGVVIPADQPWETFGTAPVYFARQTDGTFVGYYTAIGWAPDPDGKSQPDRAQQYVIGNAYATSKDGIHWEKPRLGLAEAPAAIDWQKFPPFPSPKGSSKENNLGVPFSFTDLGQYGNVSDPVKRYAISYRGRAYFAAQLPDWVHDSNWQATLTDAGSAFSPRGESLHFGDEQHKEWVGIVQNAVPHWLPAREIARFASKDLKQWRSEIVLAADPADSHRPECYDEPMSLLPFYAEGVVLGFLSWFHSDRTSPDGGPVMEKRSGPAQGWPWPKFKPVTNYNGTTLSTAPHLMEQNILPGYTLEDCQPIHANSIEHTVEFKNGSSLKPLQGRKVVLFVWMLDADLYSFRVR